MVIFDFDGTIVDVWQRYYAVFCRLMQGALPSMEDYKREKVSLSDDFRLAELFDLKPVSDYRGKKRALLEDKEYLSLDRLIVDPLLLTKRFNELGSIVLTKRRDRDALMREMDSLGLSCILDNVVVVDPDTGMSKAGWIEESGLMGSIDAVIGDSLEDMDAGNNANASLYFVETGLFGIDRIRAAGLMPVVCSDVGAALLEL